MDLPWTYCGARLRADRVMREKKISNEVLLHLFKEGKDVESENRGDN